MGTAAKAKLRPDIRFRVWREAEQRWYTDKQLQRQAFAAYLKRFFSRNGGG